MTEEELKAAIDKYCSDMSITKEECLERVEDLIEHLSVTRDVYREELDL